MIRDSIGGEALQLTSTGPIPALTKMVFYRRAPADGELFITLGLAGYGEAFFDDVSVERVESAPAAESAPASPAAAVGVARLPRPRRPDVVPSAAVRGEVVPPPRR